MKHRSEGFAWCCAATILLGSFLLFQVQPIISKIILPWFGGSPAVWTTAMLFFQVLLLVGYAYADVLSGIRRPGVQAAIHVTLLCAALAFLPITPSDAWRPSDSTHSTWRVLVLLGVSVGLPYLLLSTTAPLVQSWFARIYEKRSPYRLYALSNIGSLAALLSYPVLVEPTFTTAAQGVIWSSGFGAFAVCCAALVILLWRKTRDASIDEKATPQEKPREEAAQASWVDRLAWLLLPALASVMLLAVTSHLCQNVAVVPFLWVVPLSVYLLTFIICFDRERWYAPRWFGLASGMSVLMVSNLMLADYVQALYKDMGVNFDLDWITDTVSGQITVYVLMLFFVCMLCHGELVRRKPAAGRLTSFYLMVSAGGALGGMFVALVCPQTFSEYYELNLGLVACYLLAGAAVMADGKDKWLTSLLLRWATGAAGFAGLVVVVWAQLDAIDNYAVVKERNFYGVLTVKEHYSSEPEHHGYGLYHGTILHGYQLIGTPELENTPTTYFNNKSGVGLVLRNLHRDGPGGLRVGVIGLGAGTVAAHARPGDYFRFYELNPTVEQFARDYFSFLKVSKADKIDVVLGDARLSLENEESQKFDVLIIDAFSGDSIPTHLLTVEAFDLYLRHLRGDGVIAAHVSNRYLDLVPVVRGLAQHHKLDLASVATYDSDGLWEASSDWILLSYNGEFLNQDFIQERPVPHLTERPVLIWTDKFSNLFQILR